MSTRLVASNKTNMGSLTSTSPDALADLQRTVQRKLGRCLLRLQQYEALLKSLVAHSDIAGPPAQLQAIRDEKLAWVQKQTLGTLVGMFTGSYLTLSHGDDAAREDESGDGGLWVRFRSQVELEPERYEAIRAALKELVDLRNELVHHFLQRFNIWEVDGCTAADVHLDTGYETIDGHFLTLRGWAQSMQEAWSHMASFMATPAHQDFVVNGIWPDGTVNWPTSGVVTCLREAESRFATNGWTKLSAATAWIREQHPDQQPLRYGCGSWRQVIHESRQFEIRKQANKDSGSNEVWYRSRPTEIATK
ncbi:OST-HTH/LOTUS domain-containing protein [Ralstonia pseudosolanacearum]|uniref:OST-HTH/LOTUS domain-containing protein n=1 Tax=Ralstonia pseudosolanacearum TaxID=1310165 RepID=UPI0026FB28D9|nr:OST-HTH/LOTUS domain-containing protein [Ralstonia pseudosolanacearum]MDO3617948.1 OST-HTH/LOTUS domain-containing protein [Ralstonia pseudosolanacearum]